MKKNHIVVFSITCFLLFSCNSSNIKFIKPEQSNWICPKPGIVSEAYIGDSLLKEGTSTATPAIYLKTNHGNAAGFTAFHNKGVYKLKYIEQQPYNTSDKFDYNEYWFSNTTKKTQTVKVYQNDSLLMKVNKQYPQILEYEDGSVWLKGVKSNDKLQKSEYNKIDNYIEDSDYYFEQQLIYTGAEGNILKFAYREFVDKTARPAFSIDATYDMSRENTIRFKGAVLEIIDYNNQKITYKIISGFKS